VERARETGPSAKAVRATSVNELVEKNNICDNLVANMCGEVVIYVVESGEAW
jgi:hypothetical protein